MENVSHKYRGMPGRIAVWLLCPLLACGIALVGCGDSFVDSFNKAPVEITKVTHAANWFDHMLNTADGTTSASLRVDSGHLGSTQCTLYLYSKFCNGIFRIRLGEAPPNYTFSTHITKPPYCSDSTLSFTTAYVCSSLTPGTKYYFDIMGFWGLVQPWQLDSCFITESEVPAGTSSKTGK
jgi:hypothetical protein